MFIHAWVSLACVIVLGTLFSMVFCTPSCIASLIDSMLLYVVFLKMTPNASRSSFILCISVLCHKNIFFLTGFCLCALQAVSNRTMTWSLFLIDGRGLYRCLKVGCDVSIAFNVFYFLIVLVDYQPGYQEMPGSVCGCIHCW